MNVAGESDDNDAARMFRKGTEAVARGDWGYAIEVFQKAVERAPENQLFRDALRGAEARKKLQQTNKRG